MGQSDFFDFCFPELIEKFGRLIDYIAHSVERAGYRGRPRPRVVDDFEEGIKRELLRLNKSLIFYLSVRSPEDQLHRYSQRLLNEITRASKSFQVDHFRLKRFPADWVSEDLYVFADDVCEGVTWNQKSRMPFVNSLGTIVLDDMYDFGELNRERWEQVHGSPQSGAEVRETLFLLPKAEKDNPIAWPMLIHEVGHAILSGDESIGEAKTILGQLGEPAIVGPHVAANWAGEIAADLFATDLFGPVYVLSFISLALLMRTQPLMVPTASHPPPRIRADYMLDRLARRNMGVRDPNMSDLARHVDRMYTRGTLDHEARDRYDQNLPRGFDSPDKIRDVVGHAAEAIGSSPGFVSLNIPTFGEGDYSLSLRLVDDRLRDGVPAGSSRGMAHHGSATMAANRERAAESLSESPNTIPEIITAAAIHKLRGGVATPQAIAEAEDNFALFHKMRKGFDLLVMKSIEMSLIHQFYVR